MTRSAAHLAAVAKQKRGAKGTNLGGEFIGPKSIAKFLIDLITPGRKKSDKPEPDMRRGMGRTVTRGGSVISHALPPRHVRADDRIHDSGDHRRMGTVAWVHGDQMRVNWDDGTHDVRPVETIHDPIRDHRRSYDAEHVDHPPKADAKVGGPRRPDTPSGRMHEIVASGAVVGRERRSALDVVRSAQDRGGARLKTDAPPSGTPRTVLQRLADSPDHGLDASLFHGDAEVAALERQGLVEKFDSPSGPRYRVTPAGREKVGGKGEGAPTPADAPNAPAKRVPEQGQSVDTEASLLQGRSVADVNAVARKLGVKIPASFKGDQRAAHVANHLTAFGSGDSVDDIRHALAEVDAEKAAPAKPAPAKATLSAADREKRTKAMKRRYESGASIKDIAGEHGLSEATVHKALTDEGVQLRPRGAPAKKAAAKVAKAKAAAPSTAPQFDLARAAREQGVSDAELAHMRELIRIERSRIVLGDEASDPTTHVAISGDPEVKKFLDEHRDIYNHLAQEQSIDRAWVNDWGTHSVAEGQAQATRGLRRAVSPGNPIVIRRAREDRLRQALADGRLKTQFETGTTGGGHLDTAVRADAEQLQFGYPTDLPADQRPVYGYVAVGGLDKDNGDKLAAYGDIRIVLKPSARKKTTVSVGDSLDRRAELRPMPIDHADWHAVKPTQAGKNYDTKDFRDLSYVEAQIHGGVSWDDVDEVVFPKQPEPATVAALEAAGVNWRVQAPVGRAAAKVAKAAPAKRVVKAATPIASDVRAALIAKPSGDRRAYLEGLDLNQTQIRALAKALSVRSAGRSTSDEAIEQILKYFADS